jgi:HlyD family secretion protein
MGKHVTILLALAAVFALGLGGGVWLDRTFLDTLSTDPDDRGDYPARTGNGVRVVALGRLEPAEGVFKLGATAGERIREIRVQPGDTVQPGDVLAVFDNQAVREAEARLARVRLDEAKERRQTAQLAGDAQIKEAEARIEQARTQAPLDKEVQKVKIRVLEDQYKNARAIYEKMRQIRSFSEQEINQQGLLVRQTQEELSGAQAVFNRLGETSAAALKVAELQLATARANLNKALLEIPLHTLEANAQLAEQKLRAAEVKAPVAGRILNVFGRAGEVVGTRPLFQMADTGKMVVVAELYEGDVERVRDWLAKHPPVQAEVEARALGSRKLTGTVQSIGGTIARNSANDPNPANPPDRRAVEVRIALNPQDSALAGDLIHLPVRVEILDPNRRPAGQAAP